MLQIQTRTLWISSYYMLVLVITFITGYVGTQLGGLAIGLLLSFLVGSVAYAAFLWAVFRLWPRQMAFKS